MNDRPECGTHGCRGIGHVKGPKYATHNSASGCPYSPQNLHKVRQLSDRLNLKHETCDFEDDVQDKPKTEKTDKIKMEKSEKLEKIEKPFFSDERLTKTERDVKQEDGDFYEKHYRPDNLEKYVTHTYTLFICLYELTICYSQVKQIETSSQRWTDGRRRTFKEKEEKVCSLVTLFKFSVRSLVLFRDLLAR